MSTDKIQSIFILTAQNSALLLVSKVVAVVVAVLTGPLLARLLGVEEFGTYSSVIAAGVLIGIFIDMGFTKLVVRDVGANDVTKEESLVVGGLVRCAAVSLLTLLTATMIGLGFLPRVFLFAPILGFVRMSILFASAFFKANLKAAYSAILETAWTMSVALTIVAVVVLVPTRTASAVLFGNSIFGLSWLLLSLFMVWRVLPLRLREFRLRSRSVVSLSRRAVPFGMHLLAGYLNFQVNTLILRFVAGPTQVSYFEAALKVVMVVELIPAAIYDALLPQVARLFVEGRLEEVRKAVGYMAFLLTTIGLALGVFLFAFSENLIVLAYGEDYLHATSVLRFLAAMVVFRYLSSAFGLQMTASGYQAQRAVLAFLGGVSNIVACLALVPTFGSNGAGLAAVSSAFVITVSYFVFSARRFGLVPLGIPSVGVSIFCSCLIVILGLNHWSFLDHPVQFGFGILLISWAALFSAGHKAFATTLERLWRQRRAGGRYPDMR